MDKLSNLRLGQRFTMYDKPYEVTYSSDFLVQYSDSNSGATKQLYLDRFTSLVQQSVIEFPDLELLNENSPLYLSPDDIQARDRKLAYVKGILEHTNSPCSKIKSYPIVESIAQERLEKPPGFSTVCKWIKKYISSSYNPNSLLDWHSRKGNHQKKLDYQVEVCMDEYLQDVYLTDQRPTITAVYDMLKAKEANNEIPKLPSKRTFERRVENLSAYSKIFSRHGSLAANRMFRPAGKGAYYKRALQAVQADGHRLNLQVINEETGDVVDRPYVTMFMDVYTRCILSVVITEQPFCTSTVLLGSKLALTGAYNGLGGQFETLHVDNGSDYISKSLKNLCATLGIKLDYAPPKYPNSKAQLERFFGSLSTGLSHSIKGTTFSNIIDKGEYSSEKNACLTLKEAERFTQRWINDVYHKRLHQGISRVPLALWEESIEQHPIYQHSWETIDIIARQVEQRTINKGRVRFEGLSWSSPSLTVLAEELKRHSQTNKVDVYIDTTNLESVLIRNPLSKNDFIKAKSTNEEYTELLTLDEHRFLKGELKKQAKKDLKRYPLSDLLQLKEQLRLDIKEASQSGKKSKLKKKYVALQKRYKKEQEQGLALTPALLKSAPKTETKLHLDFDELDIEELD